MTLEEFVKDVISIPDEDKQPFCPFYGGNAVGYCDVAFTDVCLQCAEAKYEYETLYVRRNNHGKSQNGIPVD